MAKGKGKKKQNQSQAKQPGTIMMKTTTAPTSRQVTKTSKVNNPSVSYRQDGSCVVSHREYVRDLIAGTEFNVQKLPINPQQTTVFRWLASIASRFEMYRFDKLVFKYKPSCGTNTDGYVVLAFDFDAYDANPDKQAMLAWKYSAKTAPWSEIQLNCTTDSRMATFRYCDYSTRSDARLDLLGNLFFLATTPTQLLVGELFVEYTVTFRQPSYKIPFAIAINQPAYKPVNETSPGWFDTVKDTAYAIVSNAVTKIGNNVNELIVDAAGSFIVDVIATGAGIQADYSAIDITTSGVDGGHVVQGEERYLRQAGVFNASQVFHVKQGPFKIAINGPPQNTTATSFRLSSFPAV